MGTTAWSPTLCSQSTGWGKDEADFVRISAWNKQAETCSRYLTKGRQVALDGRLRSSSWEDSDGNKRSSIEVVAHRVQFLSPRPGKEVEADAEIPFETAVSP